MPISRSDVDTAHASVVSIISPAREAAKSEVATQAAKPGFRVTAAGQTLGPSGAVIAERKPNRGAGK